MILLLDTSTADCRLWLYEDHKLIHEKIWHAERDLARCLLGFLKQELGEIEKTWNDLSGLGVFQGPGSFTGLRIGMAVLNTIAGDKKLPIVTSRGENWQAEVLSRLSRGENDKIVLPFYGREANITKPRK